MHLIPVDIIPSHVYLSQDDQVALFGVGHPLTIGQERPQAGQYVYKESVNVFGKLKRSIALRVVGPSWKRSHVLLTPTEAAFLGISAFETRIGDFENAVQCSLMGPEGKVVLEAAAIIPEPHLTMSPEDANELHLKNGSIVELELINESLSIIEKVHVRVHPTFDLRLELHQDHARELWITKQTHARLVQ